MTRTNLTAIASAVVLTAAGAMFVGALTFTAIANLIDTNTKGPGHAT